MSKHVNLFEAKTKEELLELYNEFLEAEENGGIIKDSELGKIKTKYEKDFGANTLLMLQIELTHTISDLWYKENSSSIMEWKSLSNEAKSVIEWVENPFTNKKEDIEIQVGVNFQRKMPAYANEHSGKCDIPMTMKLFSEIVKYVANDSNLETVSYDADIHKYIFRIKELNNIRRCVESATVVDEVDKAVQEFINQ